MGMKLEEAKRIVELEFGYSRDMHEEPEKHDEALKVIVESLEKQIPKKILRMRSNPWILDCPTCLTSLYNYENDAHCYSCGQMIDWEVTNE